MKSKCTCKGQGKAVQEQQGVWSGCVQSGRCARTSGMWVQGAGRWEEQGVQAGLGVEELLMWAGHNRYNVDKVVEVITGRVAGRRQDAGARQRHVQRLRPGSKRSDSMGVFLSVMPRRAFSTRNVL